MYAFIHNAATYYVILCANKKNNYPIHSFRVLQIMNGKSESVSPMGVICNFSNTFAHRVVSLTNWSNQPNPSYNLHDSSPIANR